MENLFFGYYCEFLWTGNSAAYIVSVLVVSKQMPQPIFKIEQGANLCFDFMMRFCDQYHLPIDIVSTLPKSIPGPLPNVLILNKKGVCCKAKTLFEMLITVLDSLTYPTPIDTLATVFGFWWQLNGHSKATQLDWSRVLFAEKKQRRSQCNSWNIHGFKKSLLFIE